MEAARPSLTPRHTNLEEAYDAVRLCSTTAAATPTPRCPLSSATSPAYRRVREIVQLRVDWVRRRQSPRPSRCRGHDPRGRRSARGPGPVAIAGGLVDAARSEPALLAQAGVCGRAVWSGGPARGGQTGGRCWLAAGVHVTCLPFFSWFSSRTRASRVMTAMPTRRASLADVGLLMGEVDSHCGQCQHHNGLQVEGRCCVLRLEVPARSRLGGLGPRRASVVLRIPGFLGRRGRRSWRLDQSRMRRTVAGIRTVSAEGKWEHCSSRNP